MLLNKNTFFGAIIDILRRVTFLFYILNSLQITTIFILLNIIQPANLYEFLRVIASLIFPFVPAWNEYP